eukprot:1270972-Amphidinium_carterae.1
MRVELASKARPALKVLGSNTRARVASQKQYKAMSVTCRTCGPQATQKCARTARRFKPVPHLVKRMHGVEK